MDHSLVAQLLPDQRRLRETPGAICFSAQSRPGAYQRDSPRRLFPVKALASVKELIGLEDP